MNITSRYQVQGYTELGDGTPVFCICDFRDEAKTGKSPIVKDEALIGKSPKEGRLARHWTWTDRAECERMAASLNARETGGGL